MQRALALAFRARLDFPHPPLNRANEERDLAERKILSPRKNKPPFSLPRTLARLSIVLPFPQPPPVRFLFHPGHNAKIARRLLHCPLPPPYSPHRRYKTCKIEKTPAFQCLYYMYTRTCTWARVCGWRPRVNGYGTHWGGRGEKKRSQRSGGHARRTVDRYSNGPFVPAQLARPASRIHSDNDDNDDNGDNDEYDERGVLSLSLSLLLLSSPLVVVDTMVKSLSSILALFSRGCSLRLVSIIENHPRSFASFENWRFQFRSVRREIILGGDFFSRERDMIDPGIFRQRVERSFGTSIEAVSVGGAGISRYADDGWI